MGKYEPLGAYLRDLPADTQQVNLSFDEIEQIIGSTLPESMHRVPQTWANVRNANTSEDGWLSAGWRTAGLDLKAGRVSFVRSDGGPRSVEPRGVRTPSHRSATSGRRQPKYAPLTEFLKGQPEDIREIPMTFAEIEDVLGASLPACVAWNGNWWSNTRKLVQGLSWLSAGWAVRRLDVQGQRLVFVREGDSESPEERPKTLPPGHSWSVEGGGLLYEAPLFRMQIDAAGNIAWERAHAQGEWIEMSRTGPFLSQQAAAKQALPVLEGLTKGQKPKGAYARLRDYLEAIPPEQEQIVMSFLDLERVMGSRLSATARKDRSWWANTNSRNQTNTWVRAGWRVEHAHMKAELIVFRRPNTEPTKRIRHYVQTLLDGSVHLDRVDPTTLGRWIRMCKQLGWYFEGTMLYERCGVVFEDADDPEAAEAQEDYEVCKRQLTRHSRPVGSAPANGDEVRQ